MPDIEKTVDADTTIRKTLSSLLRRRGAGDIELKATSRLVGDLGMDSLEHAELSAVLEDELGRDPFSEGIIPDTVGELFDFYAA